MTNSRLPETELVYLGLGSNLQNPLQQILSARRAITAIAGVTEQAFSRLVSTPPMGPPDQPHYLNAVMAINTHLTALDLLHALQAIELDQGRVRQAQRWVARTLDVDILLYGQQVISTPELTVPHIGLHERAFVLYPLQDIAPDLVIPGVGELAHLVEQCPLKGLTWVAA
jgi:2-amino-4-hydroxy-6-hydroxymethyldihydropteridine diphosphokinase